MNINSQTLFFQSLKELAGENTYHDSTYCPIIYKRPVSVFDYKLINVPE